MKRKHRTAEAETQAGRRKGKSRSGRTELRKIGEQFHAALVEEPFRMPLDGEDGERCVDECLEGSVGSLADGKKIPAGFIDRLMMGGIDEGAASIELIEKIRPAASDMIYIVVLVFTVPLVVCRIFNMLTN